MKKVTWVLMIASFIGTMWVYPYLPDSIPTHWNIEGVADKFSSKNIIFLLALVPVLLYFMFVFIPKIDPKKENYVKHDKSYKLIIVSIIITMISIHWTTILASLEVITNVSLVIRIIIGLLFILIGINMRHLHMNYFTGIKLPWTLASETVWVKTHKVGGLGFVLIGLFSIISSIFNNHLSFYLLIGSIVLVIGFTTIYSYIIYKEEQKKRKAE